jgi:hypothetical protein
MKKIRVCDECGTPLIWTFAFAYCERYCLNCGIKGGMLGTGKDVPVTRELVFKKKLVDSIWKVIYGKKGYIPHSSQRIGCQKCVGNEKHYNHLTNSEKEWDSIARKYLESLQGIFTNPTPPYRLKCRGIDYETTLRSTGNKG